jgi:hypothetical protein
MSKRKKFSDRLLNNLKLLLVISQFLGVIGAVLIGSTLDDGFSGYVFGYIIGSLLGLGFSFGLS